MKMLDIIRYFQILLDILGIFIYVMGLVHIFYMIFSI